MSDNEWDDIVRNVIPSFWARHAIPQGKADMLLRDLRFYPAQLVRFAIQQYARDHPDETWPKSLWESVKRQCAGKRDVDQPTDQYGFTIQERANVIRILRGKTDWIKNHDDEGVYQLWLGQNGYLSGESQSVDRRMAR